MAQKEKTIQPSKAEREQTEPYQKTRDIAKDIINASIALEATHYPSLNVPPNAEADADQQQLGGQKAIPQISEAGKDDADQQLGQKADQREQRKGEESRNKK